MVVAITAGKEGGERALVCPRRYISGSRLVDSRTAAAASLGSFALSTAAGAKILYLQGVVGVHGAREGGKRAY